VIPAPALTKISQRLAAGVRPQPLPLTPLDYAPTLTFRKGKKTTRYEPSKHPAQWFFLDAFGKALRGELPYRRFLTMKPTQDGGTMVTQCIPQLYVTTQLGDPVVAGFPDMALAGKQWRSKTRPLIVDSGLTGILPTTGPGSEGNSSPTEVALDGTTLFFMGAGASNEAAQAMITGRILCRDEFDSIDPHNATLMEGRLDDYGHDAIILDNSTLKHDHATPFTKALGESTDYHLEIGCVHCGRFVRWQWGDDPKADGHVRIDTSSLSAARDGIYLECPHCHQAITDLHRIQCDMFRIDNVRLVGRQQYVDEHGQVQGPLPESIAWGLTWTALDSPRIALSYLAVKYYEAFTAQQLGVHDQMRRFYRDRLCRFYTGDRLGDDDITPTFLTRAHLVAVSAKAPESYCLRQRTKDEDGDSINLTTRPDGPAFLVAAADVQRGGNKAPPRAYFELEAADFHQSTWTVGWGHVIFCPAGRQAIEQEICDGLDRLQQILAEAAAALNLPLVKRGIDVGDNQKEVRSWLKNNRDWWAIKGASNMKAQDNQFDIPGWIYRREQHDEDGTAWWMHFPDVEARRAALDGFLMDPQAQGAAHLPRGLEAGMALIRHLCASIEIDDGKGKRWSSKETDRRWHPEWQKRNDFQDTRTYCRALVLAHVAGVGTVRQTTTISAADWFKRR
jgi:hypothetical protein